jgi:hypothetical protein
MNYPSCKGMSCNGGRRPCRENCNPPAEMACTTGEEPEGDVIGSITVGGLVAILAVFAVLGYVFGPEIVSLVRQFG